MQKIKFSIFFLFLSLAFSCFASSPLPADQAFVMEVKPTGHHTFMIHWTIAPGYFLYKDRITLREASSKYVSLDKLHFPQAEQKVYPSHHAYLIYRNHLKLPISILARQTGETTLRVQFQGCSDSGFCYPPQTKTLYLTIKSDLTLMNVTLTSITSRTPQAPTQKASSGHKALLAPSTLHGLMIILSFFGFGLLLAFTPCVLPMIPVLSGIIVGHSHHISTRKAFLLSLCYVLSMSITYSIIGVVFALMGYNLQVVMQSTWAISLFGLIFILLALAMLNVYELRLPLSWQNKLAQITRRQPSGHYLNAALMGSMSILILSPCVTPPLIGALSYITQSGQLFIGLFALFFLGLGMGTPLLLIGASAGKILPKAGKWMNIVKAFFGVIFLGTAIFLFSRILPPFITMLLWAGLLIFTGLYLGALRRSRTHTGKLPQGLGLIFLIYGFLILIGASLGNTNPIQPLSHQQAQITNRIILAKSLSEVQRSLMQAEGKPVILDFYADWCTACKIIEATILHDPNIEAALKSFVIIKIDLSANDAQTQTLLQYFHVVAPPTFIFYNAQGIEQNDLRTVGEITKDDFLNHIKRLLDSAMLK